MKAKFFLLGLLIAGLAGCGSEAGSTDENATPETTESTENTPENAVGNTDEVEQGTPTDVTKAVSEEMVYAFEQGPYKNTVTVQQATENKLEFRIEVSNSRVNCNKEIEGAAMKVEGDMESRDTDDNEAVFVEHFRFESEECGISILLDMDSGEMAWVEQFDCDAHEGDCPYGTRGVFKRVP